MKHRQNLALLAAAAAVASLAGVLIAQQGPSRDPGETVARPRKPGAPPEPDQAPIPSKLSKKAQPDLPQGLASFKSDVQVVTLDVSILDNKGHFIPRIPAGNFRVLEDNVPQQIKNISVGEAPMTVCLVVEFSNRFQQYWGETWYQTITAAYGFVQTLKPEDYLAVVAYDMRPEILSDFTTDRSKAQEALQRLRIPAFSEANLFDTLTDTADRMSGIEGRKAIVLISTGIDTFSKLTYDKTRRIMQEAGVPVYSIGLMQTLRELADAYGAMGPIQRMDFLQADNQLRTFARETGGMAFFPRFYGEFPSIFQSIAQAMRTQYTIVYAPANKTHDGKFRKLKVELVNPATNEPLRVVDEKGKPIKYSVIAKAGYTAPREVE